MTDPSKPLTGIVILPCSLEPGDSVTVDENNRVSITLRPRPWYRRGPRFYLRRRALRRAWLKEIES